MKKEGSIFCIFKCCCEISFSNIFYILTWNTAYIYNKISLSKSLLKILQINIKNSIVVLMNNLRPSIMNTKYQICMSAHSVYSTNKPIYLTLFTSTFTDRASTFLFVSIFFFFFEKDLFCFILFTDCFAPIWVCSV